MRIVDTTLRDGEQQPGIALDSRFKIEFAMLLNDSGIYQIEAGIPIMCKEEAYCVREISKKCNKSLISAWNRIKIEDIKVSMDCGVDIIHISAPVSDIMIQTKLKKDKKWLFENMQKCVEYSIGQGFETIVGFEDASRANDEYLIYLCKELEKMGVNRVRYADTLGFMHPTSVIDKITNLFLNTDIDIEFHAHNDFGMAVANSITAYNAGINYIDCTVLGIGERAGNCNLREISSALNVELVMNNIDKLENKLKNKL